MTESLDSPRASGEHESRLDPGSVGEQADATTEAPIEPAAVDSAAADEGFVVVAVTDDDAAGDALDHERVADLAAAGRQELDDTLADLQQELAGMAQTGIPVVDEALGELGDLDPNDLAGSTEILSQVLAKLESAMSETPPE